MDGLPVFSPDGQKLAWTSNRTPGMQSQIFVGAWNDAAARKGRSIDQAVRARAQIDSAQAKLNGFLSILEGKLSPQELTFERYAGAARHVHELIMANLADALDSLRVLQDIDEPAIRKALESEPSEPAAAALRDRLALFEAQRDRIERLLARNEEALTSLVRVSSAIAELPALERTSDDFDAVLSDLESLARRAQAYR